jgi:hypothetical protein
MSVVGLLVIKPMSQMGQKRHLRKVRLWQILLQKSVEGFREQ